MTTELGVKWHCYGEFKCPTCIRSWDSCVAWRDFGQECRTCRISIRAYHIEEAYRYFCKECQFVFKWKWCEEGRECSKCGEIIKTSKNHALVTRYIKANLKLHDTKLCERCKMLGRDCRTSVNMPVNEVLDISAQRIKNASSISKPCQTKNSSANSEGRFRPAPVIEDSFKKVTPGISYSSMVSGSNSNGSRNTSTSNSYYPLCSSSSNYPEIQNGTSTSTRLPVSAPKSVTKYGSESDNEDVYGNQAWAEAYQRQLQIKHQQQRRVVSSSVTASNGNGKIGKGYSHSHNGNSRNASVNQHQQQQVEASWGCQIL